jgi:hypothetical protein
VFNSVADQVREYVLEQCVCNDAARRYRLEMNRDVSAGYDRVIGFYFFYDLTEIDFFMLKIDI